MRLIDAHSHINAKEFDVDLADAISRMRAGDIGTIIVGTDYESSRRAVLLTKDEPTFFSSIGLHPADNKHEIFNEDLYRKLAEDKSVVSIGECGLDYYWEKNEEARERQRDIFRAQIKLALSLDLPLMIHCRNAYEDTLTILKEFSKDAGAKLRGNVHFFAGDIETAQEFLKLGFTMSFTGVITFTSDYDNVIRHIPIDSILAETDCPYVTPVPNRGKRNEPLFVEYVVARLALIKGVSAEKMAEITLANTSRVFDLGTRV
jgi:TatD DNase family protein